MKQWRFVLAGSALLLAAAGKPDPHLSVQIADTGPFAAKPAAPAPKPASSQPLASLEAAPVPNLNLEAPPGAAAAPTAQLNPALLSQKAVFDGNAFNSTSSQEQALLDRDRPAAGISLSVPVR